MSKRERTGGFLERCAAALLRRKAGTGPMPETEAGWRARVATLEMDLRERDERIRKMQAEYGHIEAARQRAETEAGADELARLFKRLAGSLSNLATLEALDRSGRPVEAGDLLSLFEGLMKELRKAGLEQIGDVGEEAGFDAAAHQRMSGGGVHPGTPVVVEMPGYRLGETVILKAMVRSKEE
ncbi:MAG TPA: hypothetical protein PKI11_15285 [Candidatus Hydrogenedentes bacterium]|nr:hypothetical protein [Candidatus Hydrogenedentota bacterium]HNT87734.1 hypothetical protein [Candidatus Hydrogenedentota bacterium]